MVLRDTQESLVEEIKKSTILSSATSLRPKTDAVSRSIGGTADRHNTASAYRFAFFTRSSGVKSGLSCDSSGLSRDSTLL
jgi:hypothetical protein